MIPCLPLVLTGNNLDKDQNFKTIWNKFRVKNLNFDTATFFKIQWHEKLKKKKNRINPAKGYINTKRLKKKNT